MECQPRTDQAGKEEEERLRAAGNAEVGNDEDHERRDQSDDHPSGTGEGQGAREEKHRGSPPCDPPPPPLAPLPEKARREEQGRDRQELREEHRIAERSMGAARPDRQPLMRRRGDLKDGQGSKDGKEYRP